jgi:hypothetical protein
MNLKELVEKEIVTKRTLDGMYVNVLEALKSEEFERRNFEGCYRKRAVERAIKLKVGFTSEINTLTTLAEKLIDVSCPHCHKSMKFNGGCGSSTTYTVCYECAKCKCAVRVTLPSDGIEVTYKED